jgi:hypothetical protein
MAKARKRKVSKPAPKGDADDEDVSDEEQKHGDDAWEEREGVWHEQEPPRPITEDDLEEDELEMLNDDSVECCKTTNVKKLSAVMRTYVVNQFFYFHVFCNFFFCAGLAVSQESPGFLGAQRNGHTRGR